MLANEVYKDFRNGYGNAHHTARANLATNRVSKPKFKGAEAQNSTARPPIASIHVVVRLLLQPNFILPKFLVSSDS